MANVERAIAEALAERLGTDLEQDPYPVLLAATGTGVLRSAMTFWARTGGTVPIDQLTDVAFAALAGGLAEDCALRRLTAARDVTGTRTALLSEPTGKDNDG
jgi:hypothetical protein